MISRRMARQAALEVLYQIEVSDALPDEVFNTRQRVKGQPVADFTYNVVKGVISNKEYIDKLIDQCSENWSIDRISVIDKNIMRIAIFEMINEHDIPFSISINEAVELAKKFGSEDSGKFINGVVAKVATTLRPARLRHSGGHVKKRSNAKY